MLAYESWRIDIRRARHYNTLVAAVFVVALALRVGVAATFTGLSAPPDAGAQPDQLDYEWLAHRVSVGEGYTLVSGVPTYYRPPGTSWSLLPVYLVGGRSFTLGRLWFCLLSALTCVAVAWLGRLVFNRAVGLTAALWLAVYPGHFYYSMHFLSEVPYALYLTVGAAATVRAFQAARDREAGSGWNALAGVSWAMAVLTRPQLIFVLPVAGLAVVSLLHERSVRFATCLAVQLLVVAAVLMPWVLRNSWSVGRATIAGAGAHVFWGAHNERILADAALRGSWVRNSDLVDAEHPISGPESERERAAWRYGLDFVRRHPAEMPMLEAMKLVRLLSPFEDTPNRVVYWCFALGWLGTAPFVVLGFWLLIRENAVAAAVMAAPLLATVLSTLVFYGSGRFRDSAAPLLVLAAARGLMWLLPDGLVATNAEAMGGSRLRGSPGAEAQSNR